MSKSIKIVALFGFVATVAACGSSGQTEEEFVVVDPAPITTEPVHTGKYK